MPNNPYRYRRSRKFLNGCLVVIVSFVFVGTNMFLTTWLTPFQISEQRSLRSVDSMIMGIDNANDDGNDNGLLHVVTTRFMQDQPKLHALGKARLSLFEAFCLPTMINQEADNFLWFVMTDPELDHNILLRLQTLLESRPNFYLIRSNDKLDADDGLHKNALSQIQKISRALPVDTRGWQIICSNIHYEWRNDQITTIHYTNRTEEIESSGQLRVVRESICVTPGYTLVKHRVVPSIEFPAWPRLGHNLVAREWPECMIEDKSIISIDEENNKQGNATHNCWIKMGYYPSALRSRTITSAGMSRIDTYPGDEEKYENRTKVFWGFLRRDFDVEPESARLTSQYIKNNLESIVQDNLKGQCSIRLEESFTTFRSLCFGNLTCSSDR
ncbi:hypothetical protein FRACYDRAFT_249658 [Fragilariopsis cylindrus CCMP1102]|uniref:Uncharacterized protein n=1 Tax=Fragilariopsis cylindrus CCMP1102 TaxID=635003 RepID=A0A1E7ET61_9STRA|nr:hypothetical protein FRACYDRAFT_249658 [Fragilariopsis cylindrus CCMP1102]|eukprot:OEU08753.1 hypothetical protein FRACYDRAFT_249658 [Fragilariopsis cylindrus CCMP1102]